MKLIILVVTIIFLITGCCSVSKQFETETTSSNQISECDDVSKQFGTESTYSNQSIHVAETERSLIPNTIEFPIDYSNIKIKENINSVSTAKEAENIATYIIEEFHKNNKFSDFKLVATIHSKKDNTWRFEYNENPNNIWIDSGSLFVTINAQDGRIINAWIEEG